ncbi:PTS cellobiose transporter subunit IIA [Sporolactobacillus laevolacticus]|uniref:PTS cellobiose transporter subunit IIA n=1 Tax=Sporolactobacillus laevolacticus TaxID=33018 RepID=UPI0025B5D31B|nr:PTS cellobiose transporter subunit IIA [Sporolactobacillus laevolacticus]MDN3954757.1 PTS cellobiose transporter subunit IIA [Sporolactobacillus laevolacticus]
MDENLQVVAFDIILHSGSARAMVHEAFKFMREGNFEMADAKLADANQELLKAHKSQTQLLQDYAKGKKIEMEIIMIHAQDHLMTTMTLREVAIEMEHLYRRNEGALI